MITNFSFRSTTPELMDQTALARPLLDEVLKDINKVNNMLGGYAITKEAVLALIKNTPQEQYTILDMGCGDGTMLREIAALFRERQIKAQFIGIDINEGTIQIAKEQVGPFSEITFLQQDILAENKEELQCDILLCTLTMHHFSDEQIPVFLNKFAQLASIGVVINDLQRSKWAYVLFKVFSVFFIKTPIAKCDGLLSIQKGFLKTELLQYAKNVVNASHHIEWKWAYRYLWIMNSNKMTS